MSKSLNNYKTYSDEILMEKFGRGDSSAFEELFFRYSTKITYYLRKLLKNDIERAKDITQDIFMGIIRNPKQFNTQKKFSVWIYKVAYNKFVNEFHSNKMIDYTDEIYENIEYESSYEFDIDNKFAMDIIDSEIELMNEKSKTTFILKYKENYSLQEIADVLNCPLGTVKSRLFNILKKIASKLEKNEINKGFYYEN